MPTPMFPRNNPTFSAASADPTNDRHHPDPQRILIAHHGPVARGTNRPRPLSIATGDHSARAHRNRGHWAALLHLIRAHIAGWDIEIRHGDTWVPIACPHFLDQPDHYRIKP